MTLRRWDVNNAGQVIQAGAPLYIVGCFSRVLGRLRRNGAAQLLWIHGLRHSGTDL